MKMRSELFQSMALVILLAVGAGLAWGFLAAWGMSVVSDVASSGDVYENVVFLRDGTPVIESYARRDYEARTFRTLEGNRVEVKNDDMNVLTNLQGPEYLSKRFAGLVWNERITCVHNDWYGPDVWYFMHDGKPEGHGYFVSYDKKAKAKIGYIGTGGFTPEEPPLDQQFPVNGRRVSRRNWYGTTAMLYGYNDGEGSEVQYLLADDGLREINVKKRSVKILRKGDDLISGGLSSMPLPAKGKAAVDRTILLRSPDRVDVLALDGKEIASYPLPSELRSDNFGCLALPGGKTLIDHGIFNVTDLFWLDAGGKIVRREHVTLRNLRQSQAMTNTIMSIVIPSPGVIAGVGFAYPWALADCPDSWTYSDALRSALAKTWPILLATEIISLVLACVVYRRQRRYGLPWTWVWTVLVLLFGLPAFFGYFAHRAWPARLPCPHCGRRVPHDRPACFICGREFPPPAVKGIEVFA